MIDRVIVGGTTDKIDLVVDSIDFADVTALEVKFAQYGFERFTKTLEDVTIDGNTVSVPLSQTDTLTLKAKKPVSIQMRILFSSGDAEETEIINIGAGETLMTDEITPAEENENENP